MRIEDVACRASGFVRPSFIDMTTGRVVPFGMRHNLLSFMSAEAMSGIWIRSFPAFPSCRLSGLSAARKER